MSRTLPVARQEFVAAIKRDIPGPDLPRLAAVLDAVIAWSVARPGLLTFRTEEGRAGVISFDRAGSTAVFWSAQVTRRAGPRLEIHPPNGRPLSAEDRARVMETLNAHSREVLIAGDRLRIGFGALKNVAARTAVLALMKQLLAGSGQTAESSPAGAVPPG
jgi:hypothetical protein